MTALPVTRPALRYMGGKWRLAPWILDHMPPHVRYVEPYCGAASVLMRKPRSHHEVINDLDGQVVNLFRVLRDPGQCARLVRDVHLTPFAREEFLGSYELTEDPVEAARRTLVRSFMGHGSTAVALRRRTGFRADNRRQGRVPARDWMNLPAGLEAIAERLAGVVIENRPALELIEAFDAPGTLLYLDPPYLHDVRSQKRVNGALEHAYAYEMSAGDHAALLERIGCCKAMVLLSGYRSDLYDEALAGWDCVECDTHADGARPRREALWINPAATAATGLLGRMNDGRGSHGVSAG